MHHSWQFFSTGTGPLWNSSFSLEISKAICLSPSANYLSYEVWLQFVQSTLGQLRRCIRHDSILNMDLEKRQWGEEDLEGYKIAKSFNLYCHYTHFSAKERKGRKGRRICKLIWANNYSCLKYWQHFSASRISASMCSQ